MTANPSLRMIASRPPPCFQHVFWSLPEARDGPTSLSFTVTVTVTEFRTMDPSSDILAKLESSASHSVALNVSPSIVTSARPRVMNQSLITLVERNQAQRTGGSAVSLTAATKPRSRQVEMRIMNSTLSAPNGSRLSCGRPARRRKGSGRQSVPARAQHSASLKAITARQLQALVRPPPHFPHRNNNRASKPRDPIAQIRGNA